MQPFSLIHAATPTVASAEEVFGLVAVALPDIAAIKRWSLDLAGEEAVASELAQSNPDALVVLAHALSQRFADLRRWPKTHAHDVSAVRRLAAEALASKFPATSANRPAAERMRIAIMVPWLSFNPNGNLLRVVAGYLAGLLRQEDVEDVLLVVTNELATGDPNRGELFPEQKPRPDARQFRTVHAHVLEEFGAPPGKLRYAPPPFAEGGNICWMIDFAASYAPDVVFVPNFDMTLSAIHGLGRNAATVYLQTSINNRPSYDFDRYLYLGGRREIDGSHLHPQRWRYHSFGYEPFGFGSGVSRADMGLSEGDYVMVTAGNRLELEINPEISGIIANVMGDDPGRKWLLLGVRDEQRVRANMGEAGSVIGDRTIFKGYVMEVGDYLSCCNAYVNPRRTGGAVSMSLAVYGNTPIISFTGSDACNFLLDEQICETVEQYTHRLRRLADNHGYSADLAIRQRHRFDACHTADMSAADLVVHFKEAIATRSIQ